MNGEKKNLALSDLFAGRRDALRILSESIKKHV